MYEVMMFTDTGTQVVGFTWHQLDDFAQFLDVLQERNVTYIAMTDRAVVAFQAV